MKHFAFALLILMSPVKTPAGDIRSFILKTDAFLKKYVDNGFVAYAEVKHKLGEAEDLYKEIGKLDVAHSSSAERKAFYTNAYNIIVIYWIAKHYPIKSPMDHAGFFDKERHAITGEDLTLNELENKKLLQPYKDARIHFALACAAQSCPPLANFAYTAEKIEEQLSERAALTLNNKDWIKVYPKQKKVELSKIFEWYKGDFNRNGKSSIDWINEYREDKIPASYAVGFYEYNWSLNEKK